MNIDEAKRVLQSYRPGTEDERDPFFAEALGLARNDPALRLWLEKQQAFDGAMGGVVQSAEVPADLRSGILDALRKESGEKSPAQVRSFPFPLWLGAAAALALVAAVAWKFWPQPKLPADQSVLAEYAIGDAQHPKTHGGKGEEAAELNRVLKLPTTRLSEPLPVDFSKLHDSGCRIVKVEGRDVLEVCFKRNGVGMHCYIAKRDDFPKLTAPPKPTISDKAQASIATWADDKNLYIVVTKPEHEAFEGVL
jgi:hypothetical protein